MKTKYLFVKCSGEITESTLFVDVYVGKSAQDQRDRDYFTQLANISGDYYFHVYDLDVSRYVQRIGLSLQAMLNDQRVRVLHCSMSATKLRRLLKSNLYDQWAQIYFQTTRGIRRMNINENHAYFLAVGRADKALACRPRKKT